MYQYKDPYVIDFTDVTCYLEMHKTICQALDFPDYYGCNWDAFWDCLTNMVGRRVHIEIRGLDVIEQKLGEEAEILIDILKEFKHYRNDKYSADIQIDIADGNTYRSLT